MTRSTSSTGARTASMDISESRLTKASRPWPNPSCRPFFARTFWQAKTSSKTIVIVFSLKYGPLYSSLLSTQRGSSMTVLSRKVYMGTYFPFIPLSLHQCLSPPSYRNKSYQNFLRFPNSAVASCFALALFHLATSQRKDIQTVTLSLIKRKMMGRVDIHWKVWILSPTTSSYFSQKNLSLSLRNWLIRAGPLIFIWAFKDNRLTNMYFNSILFIYSCKILCY